jgi:hypothetical protein
MGSEREYNEKVSKVRDNISKKTNDVASAFAKMHKIKSETIKKTEDMLKDGKNDLSNMEKKINVDKDLAPESRDRLDKEISIAREELQAQYETINQQINNVDIPAFNPIATKENSKAIANIKIPSRR